LNSCSTSEVQKLLENLEVKKATGLGKLPPKLLNLAARILAPSYQRHMPTQLIPWECDPRPLKCFAFSSLDQQELFLNVTSNALFCVLQVWQDFIRFVVQRLLSRGTNFHSSKHIRNYTQDGLVNLIFEYERRGLNEPTRL